MNLYHYFSPSRRTDVFWMFQSGLAFYWNAIQLTAQGVYSAWFFPTSFFLAISFSIALISAQRILSREDSGEGREQPLVASILVGLAGVIGLVQVGIALFFCFDYANPLMPMYAAFVVPGALLVLGAAYEVYTQALTRRQRPPAQQPKQPDQKPIFVPDVVGERTIVCVYRDLQPREEDVRVAHVVVCLAQDLSIRTDKNRFGIGDDWKNGSHFSIRTREPELVDAFTQAMFAFQVERATKIRL